MHVTLTDEEINARGRELAAVLEALRQDEEDARDAAKFAKDRQKELRDRISKLARAVRTGQEEREEETAPLFPADALSPAAAAVVSNALKPAPPPEGPVDVTRVLFPGGPPAGIDSVTLERSPRRPPDPDVLTMDSALEEDRKGPPMDAGLTDDDEDVRNVS